MAAEAHPLNPRIDGPTAAGTRGSASAAPVQEPAGAPRHGLLVRVTHWVHAVSFLALLGSGVAILLAYPRLHWGETGALGMPSWIDLPLPQVLELGIRGPGRSIHFLSAWVTLFTGLVYGISGLWSQHFQREMVPTAADLKGRSVLRLLVAHVRFERPRAEEEWFYNLFQKLSYLGVVFVLVPFMFVTGLAMSPTFSAVVPWMVDGLGGHQSARTLHFFAANLLFLFLLVHVAMVVVAGFWRRCGAMVTGYPPGRRKTT